MSLAFQITSNNGISIVSFKGKIISDADIDRLTQEITSHHAAEVTHLIFDFEDLTHINSSGINFIIRSLTRSRVNNRDLVLTSIKGNVKTLFEIAKMNEIITVYPSISEAINHFKN